MYATVSSKGQVTLPKAIRDQLGLSEGARLDLEVVDGSLRGRPVSRTALDILGALCQPGRKAVSVEEMKEAIETAATARYRNNYGLCWTASAMGCAVIRRTTGR
ncbi:MAG: AbrB/MazE/SpoVT family DNA-binding domain-containing protein [Azoarcus sp.]|jgi:AbrB family looped-hinge helix DNA binding protein|nr:AbrB/MazE/SpoVT family DNA-binding domain-containing protein [Azoarcus sp.]